MDSNDGGHSSEHHSRESATEAARRKVLAVYSSAMQSLKKVSGKSKDEYIAPPVPGGIYSTPELTQDGFDDTFEEDNTPSAPDFVETPTETYQAPAQPQTAYQPQPYQETPVEPVPSYDQTDETSALKDVPINQTAVNEEWQQYHSAWQNYYQNYYSDYYAKAAQSYLETEKLKSERIARGEDRKKRRAKHLVPIFIILGIVIVALFLQYNRLIFAPIMAYVVPDSDSVSTSIESVNPNITQAVSPDPRLIIPKLNIDVPVAFGINYSEVMSAMNRGVAQFMVPGANAMPGQAGNLVISGHSAGDIYSSNPYKFIFSGLERLENGDLLYVNYNSIRYTYRMIDRKVVEPSDVQALMLGDSKPYLTLITCTPLGTSRYRLLIIAEQISPEFDENTETPDAGEMQPSDIDYSMPANEPSLFDNILHGIFGN